MEAIVLLLSTWRDRDAYIQPRCLRQPYLAGTCPAESPATSTQPNAYELASSNRNAAYSQHRLTGRNSNTGLFVLSLRLSANVVRRLLLSPYFLSTDKAGAMQFLEGFTSRPHRRCKGPNSAPPWQHSSSPHMIGYAG
jgi:hypothetical protein